MERKWGRKGEKDEKTGEVAREGHLLPEDKNTSSLKKRSENTRGKWGGERGGRIEHWGGGGRGRPSTRGDKELPG